MTITLRITGLNWPRRQHRILGMSPEQWKARCKQVGLPCEQPDGTIGEELAEKWNAAIDRGEAV